MNDNNDNNDNIGILDPEGKNLNPFTNQSYSDTYKKLAQIWSKYPAYQNAKERINDIMENQVLLINAATSAGKTVIYPKFTLHALGYKGKVGVTLPKQLITKSAAEFAAKTLDVEVGSEVGYQFKGSPKNAYSDKTKLLYATDGTIKAMLINDPSLIEFDAILIDEAHERKVQIDFLLYLLRNTLKLRPNFKLIIMSATINSDIFKEYYKEFKFKEINLGGARKYPITSHFLKPTEQKKNYEDLKQEAFKILIKILEEDNPEKPGAHDILFFITSKLEAITICKKLNKHIEAEKKAIDKKCKITCTGDVVCMEIFSGISPERERLVIDKDLYKAKSNYNRKVVLATNVAESSITIDGIKYVIDLGHELKSVYDAEHRARNLKRELISHAQATQRMGRAGRTEPGICYHMYTEDDYLNKMEKFPLPDIRTNDLSNECLQLLNIDTINTTENLINVLIQLIEPPKEIYIKTAINILNELGAIENEQITPLGKMLTNIKVNDPMTALSIILATQYKCSHELIKLFVIIDLIKGNIIELFNKPDEYASEQTKKKFNNAKKQFAHDSGDHISLLNIYDEYNKQVKDNSGNIEILRNWCRKNFLKYEILVKVNKQYRKIKATVPNMDNINLGLSYDKDIDNLPVNDRILYCILVGFKLNIAINKYSDLYQTQFSDDIKIKISNTSFISYLNKQPRNVVYHELFISLGRNDLNIVSNINKNIMKLM